MSLVKIFHCEILNSCFFYSNVSSHTNYMHMRCVFMAYFLQTLFYFFDFDNFTALLYLICFLLQ